MQTTAEKPKKKSHRPNKQPELPGTPPRGAAYRAAQEVLKIKEDVGVIYAKLEKRQAEVRELMKKEKFQTMVVEHPDNPADRFNFTVKETLEKLSIIKAKESFKSGN